MLIAALVLLLDPTVGPQDPPPPAQPPVIRIDPQIQSWLDRSPARGDASGVPIWDENRTFGEVSVSVGTGGYRAFGGSVSTPVGERGRVSLHYQQSEGEGPRGRPYGYGYDGYDRSYWGRALGADDRPLRGAGSSID